MIIDNTHVQGWEARPYVLLALRHDYQISIKEPLTAWAKDPVECAQRNQHGVSLQTIERMLQRWESLDLETILESQRK